MATRHVKPVLSLTRDESRKRVLNLYRAWHRQIPEIIFKYKIPKTRKQCVEKLREEFKRNAHVTDIRVIDLLVVKGQMDLQEALELWKTDSSIMNYWKETCPEKKSDFMSKFVAGHD